VVRKIQKEKKKATNPTKELSKKRHEEVRLRASIIPYSDKKINTKPTAEYSTLNPLISSLSPSAKSKGARLHSHTHLTHHRPAIRNDTENYGRA
jgi:hypothetical protein